MDFLNKVYLYKENTNIFNFKEIITHIWIKVIKHLENSFTSESRESFENKKSFFLIQPEKRIRQRNQH